MTPEQKNDRRSFIRNFVCAHYVEWGTESGKIGDVYVAASTLWDGLTTCENIERKRDTSFETPVRFTRPTVHPGDDSESERS